MLSRCALYPLPSLHPSQSSSPHEIHSSPEKKSIQTTTEPPKPQPKTTRLQQECVTSKVPPPSPFPSPQTTTLTPPPPSLEPPLYHPSSPQTATKPPFSTALLTLLLPTLSFANPLPAEGVEGTAAVWEMRCGGTAEQHYCTQDLWYACTGNGQIVNSRSSPDCDFYCSCVYA